MEKISKILLFITLTILAIFLCIKLAGYEINKDFFSNSKQSCMQSVNPSEVSNKVFWMRWADLLKQNETEWRKSFKRDDTYCYSLQNKVDENYSGTGMHLLQLWSTTRDAKCDIDEYISQRIHESQNWEYMVSNDKDKFYYQAIDELCPVQYLLK